MNIALLGLDTSHGPAFARILKEDFTQHRLLGAWPGGSEHIPASRERVGTFTREVEAMGLPILPTPEAAAADADAVFILSLDADTHAPLLSSIARPELKVFIDKPLANTSVEAGRILEVAAAAETSLFSASALRFLPAVQNLLLESGRGKIHRLQLRAPLNPIEGVPRYHFYAIHAVEILIALLGPKICEVKRIAAAEERFHLKWPGGAEAELELTSEDGAGFDLSIETQSGEIISLPGIEKSHAPRYRPLLEACLKFFATGESPVKPVETLAILSVLEMLSGRITSLDG